SGPLADPPPSDDRLLREQRMSSPDGGEEVCIDFREVRKSFGALEVLKGITASIPTGATVAVLGSSGSGKSTLVRCVNHLEKISGGEIRVLDVTLAPREVRRNNQRLSERRIARYRADIGMVFQS